VHEACRRSSFDMPANQRRQLISALMARRHLILSGPAGLDKTDLAMELALALVQRRQNQLRLIQGHPWWAAGTGDTGRFVNLQMEFSVWRLVDFVDNTANGTSSIPHDHVALITRMSPVETDFYFGAFAQWLFQTEQQRGAAAPLRLIGTCDSPRPPRLDARILQTTAVVHLGQPTNG
jgi:hypothetical protein